MGLDGYYSENVFKIKGWGGLYRSYSICLPIFIYKPWLVNEGGLNMRVAYPMNFFPDNNKPRSNISRAASGWELTVMRSLLDFDGV